jgi:Concanavalin A-like lectin/glucanases superfamily
MEASLCLKPESMKTKCLIPHSSSLLLMLLSLFTAAARAPAQSVWGYALSFDGTSDAVSATGITLTNTSMTLELWAKRATPGKPWDPFLCQGWAALSNGLYFSFYYNAVAFGYYGDELWTPQIFADTNWHHWAATHNRATGERCIYQDGRVVATDTNWGSYTGSGEFWIAEMPFSAPDYFGGQLDEVRVWNVARSAAEIRQNLYGPLTGQEPNLIACWSFDEGSGATAHDGATNGYDGTLHGPEWTLSTISPWGNALSFDGVNDYVRAAISPLVSDYTVSAWVYLRAGGNVVGGGANVVGLLSATSCGASAEVLIRSQTSSSTDPQYVELGRCNSFVGMSSTREVPLNQWTHVAVSVSSTKQVEYFINGIAAGSWDASARDLTIGPNITLGDNTVRRFNGILDDVRIWNKARTEAEIQADLAHPLTGSESNLVAYWNFNEGAGETAHDRTTNARDGTLVAGPFWTASTAPWGAAPAAEITSPQCPVWADAGKPLEFVVTGIDPDNDLSYCDMGVDGPVVGQKYFTSSNSGATCTFTYTFTKPGTNLVWFQAFDMQHNPSTGAHCTVYIIRPPANTNLTVLTYNTHLFEDSPLECIIKAADFWTKKDVNWERDYWYWDDFRNSQCYARVRNSGADIVALEEVWACSWRSAWKSALNSTYPYIYHCDSSFHCLNGLRAINLALPTGIDTFAPAPAPWPGTALPDAEDWNHRHNTEGNGLVLLSKYPLSDITFQRFPTYTQGDLDAAQDSWADKGVITATADVGGDPIRIGISHALTGPDDYLSSERDYTAATIFTFKDKRGYPYYFGVTPENDWGYVTSFENYSYKDQTGLHYAVGRKQVGSPRSMQYGCVAATSFELDGNSYFYGHYNSGEAIIRRFNDDPATGWVTTGTISRSPGYTCVTSFELNGEPYISMNYPPDLNAYIFKVSPGATNTTLASCQWIGDLASSAFFTLNGRPYLLAIHKNNKAVVYRVEDDGCLTWLIEVPWGSDWTPTSYELNGQPYILAHSYADSYKAQIWKVVDPYPTNWLYTVLPYWNNEPNGCDGVRSFELDGHPYLIALKNCCNEYPDSTRARNRPRQVAIWRVNDDGQGLEPMFQLEDIRMIRDATVVDKAGPPAIMMGDFNIHKGKYGIMDNIFKQVGAVDAYVQVHGTALGGETISPTNILYHHFWPEETNYSRIDYVYVKASGNGALLDPVNAYVIRDWRLPTPPANNEDLSDHYPLLVEFRLQESCRLEAGPLADGHYQLSITGTIGRLGEVQCSSDLFTWDKLAEFRIASSPHLFTDPTPVTTGDRFYRLRLLP